PQASPTPFILSLSFCCVYINFSPPHQSTPFPYTTLFRSPIGSFDSPADGTSGIAGAIPVTGWALDNIEVTKVDVWREPIAGEPRSEEHTSELQSPCNLVCRLLLEKKNNTIVKYTLQPHSL